MKKLFKATALAVVLCFALSVLAVAIDLPEPTDEFFVNDFANVISDEDEEEIMAIGASLYNQTTAQIVVVTVDSLDGYDVEEYGLELGREWGVGSEESDNGVVLLMSVSDRQVTIQVGYGLEGCLPDGKTGRILDEYAVPYLSNDDFSTGLTEAYKAITSVVYQEYDVVPEEDFDYSQYELVEEDDFTALEIAEAIVLVLVISVIMSTKTGRRIFVWSLFGRGFHNHDNDFNNHHHGGGFSGGGGSFRGGGGSFGGGGSSRGF